MTKGNGKLLLLVYNLAMGNHGYDNAYDDHDDNDDDNEDHDDDHDGRDED